MSQNQSSFGFAAGILSIVSLVSIVLFWAMLHVSLTFSNDILFRINGFAAVSLLTVLFFCLTFASLVFLALGLPFKFFTGISAILAASALFFFPFSYSSIIALAFFWLGLIWMFEKLHSISQNSVTIHLSFFIRRSLGLPIILGLMLVSFFYYQGVARQDESKGLDAISGLSQNVGSLANQLIPRFLPNYKPNITLDDFILNEALRQAQSREREMKNGIPDDLLNRFQSNPNDSNEFLKTIVPETEREKIRNDFLEPFGIQATGKETMTEIIQKIISQKAHEYLDPYSNFIPPFFAILLFFFLHFWKWFYFLLIELFASFLHMAYAGAKLVLTRKDSVEKETMILGK